MRFLPIALILLSATAHADDDALLLPDKSRHDCVVAISDLQLKEIAGDNEDLSPALGTATKLLAENGFEVMRVESFDRDMVADLTGRALFLEYRGALSSQVSCHTGMAQQAAVSQMALGLSNEIAQGNTIAKTWGQSMAATAKCTRKLASVETTQSLEQESRMKALSSAIKHLPQCKQLQDQHLQGWLF